MLVDLLVIINKRKVSIYWVTYMSQNLRVEGERTRANRQPPVGGAQTQFLLISFSEVGAIGGGCGMWNGH
jgi:hypothetical protein